MTMSWRRGVYASGGWGWLCCGSGGLFCLAVEVIAVSSAAHHAFLTSRQRERERDHDDLVDSDSNRTVIVC